MTAAILNYACEAGDGSTAAFTAGGAAKMTRAVRQSQVRAVNDDFGHLLYAGLQAMSLVSVTIWEPSLEVTTFGFGFILLPSSVRKASATLAVCL